MIADAKHVQLFVLGVPVAAQAADPARPLVECVGHHADAGFVDRPDRAFKIRVLCHGSPPECDKLNQRREFAALLDRWARYGKLLADNLPKGAHTALQRIRRQVAKAETYMLIARRLG